MSKTIMALSHSRLSDYNQCPRKFQLKYIEKPDNFKVDDSDKSSHLVRGQNVHKALEKYVLKRVAGEQDIPPSSLPEVENTKPYLDGVFKNFTKIIPEQQISVDSNYNQVDWFAKNSYYRAIFDLIAIGPESAKIDDYKTGKFKDYDAGPTGYGQLHLAACIGFGVMPNVQRIDTNYLFVDHRKIITRSFDRKVFPILKEHFDKEHQKVNSEVNFDPVKNEYCRYCEATKAQCPYSNKMEIKPLGLGL
jgi:hypothetical protein